MALKAGQSIAPVHGNEYVRLWREKSLDLAIALGELADNGFDAAATEVEIQFSLEGDYCRILDNGEGVPELDKIFQIGHSSRHGSAQESGIHGIGFKDAVIQLGDGCYVSTCRRRDGKVLRTFCNFSQAAPEGLVFQTPFAVSHHEWRQESRFSHGTLIRCSGLDTSRYPRHQWSRLIREERLDQLFWPATVNGASLRIHDVDRDETHVVQNRPFQVAEWFIRDRFVETDDGRSFRFSLGALPQASKNAGVTIIRGFRVIRTSWRNPFEQSMTLYGEVMLPASTNTNRQTMWKPDRNKERLSLDADMAAIRRAIVPIVKPYIAQEHNRSLEIRIQKFMAPLNELVSVMAEQAGLIDRRKATRDRNQNPTGTIEATDTGPKKKRTNHPKVESGEREPMVPPPDRPKRSSGGIEVRYAAWHSAEELFSPGAVEPPTTRGEPWVVVLNTANPYISHLFSSDDITEKHFGLGQTVAALLAFQSAELDTKDPRQRVFDGMGRPIEVYQNLLRSLHASIIGGDFLTRKLG